MRAYDQVPEAIRGSAINKAINQTGLFGDKLGNFGYGITDDKEKKDSGNE